ncbi:hypothetical protein RISK_002516 [Rhodopirellula islandica]|uniref:DNA primase/helicase Gp4 N-terminal Bacteriophage T7-like domain-containing protein n=1 Tax=Rhodopirellula islandica TaxID=595434 RepID=A0A0J1EK61_RHOIS|nr:primase-helicase zinc-binding domain-containing protein [Rhodopirellula islandica]KLU05884.1 hypothetical protein RISK_002516 [Rhodopirellula islandica]
MIIPPNGSKPRRKQAVNKPKSRLPLSRDIVSAGSGQWVSLLQKAGMPAECLNGRQQPCPKCGGEDRFNASKDVNVTGAVFCRHCFKDKSTKPIRPGNGIATVAWLQGIEYLDAKKWVATQLGMTIEGPIQQVDIITATARDKRMPVEAFKQFGVKKAKRGRGCIEVCRIDVYDETGQVHSYFDLRPGEKGWVKKGKGSSGLFFPGRLPKPGEKWLAVEGVKDAAALVSMGFNAFGYVGNRMDPKYARLFEGVDVIVVPDLDTAGITGADLTAGNLLGIATSVAVARLPGTVKDKAGEDVRDVLQKPDGEKQVREAIEAAKPWSPSDADEADDQRPKVIVTMNEAEVTDEVICRLGKLGLETPWIEPKDSQAISVFVRGGMLVQLVKSDDVNLQGCLTIRDLPPCLVRERITQAVQLVTEKEIGDEAELKPTRPPGWLVDAIVRRGSFGGAVRPLSGIIESPTIRVDGSILQTPGYDQQTGLLFHPSANFPAVPENPTKADAAKAMTALLDVLADFPMFEDADRSAWVSMVLSMIGRACVAGYVPLFAVTANTRGAGKSLLVDAATLIAYGHRAARKAFTRDDDEMRKTITAVAIGAVPSVLFDNLDIQLGGASLDAAITSSTWSDRVLGQSRMTGDLPMRTVWAATGNNMAFGSDVGRRVLPIRLQSPLETPEDRTGFAHPDLLSWIEADRPRLAVAALTILRAYFVAGCPMQPNGDWGSFENWSATIRGAIVWAGGADPLPTRATALASDDTAALLGKLIAGIETAEPSGIGLTVKEIQVKTFGSQADYQQHEVLAEAVFEICGEHFNAHKLGRRIRGMKGRVHNGKFIDDDSAGGGVKRWRVRSAESGFGGFGGSNSTRSELESELSHSGAADLPCDNQQINRNQPETNPSNPPDPPDNDSTSSTGGLFEQETSSGTESEWEF